MIKTYNVKCRETYVYEYEVEASSLTEAKVKAKSMYLLSDDDIIGVADGTSFENVCFDIEAVEQK